MIPFIYKLLGLCVHEWETIDEEMLMTGPTSHVTRYTLRCKKCGNIKSKTV